MAKLPAQVKRQIEYALFLAAGQDDPHSVTITELCASLSRLTADNEALRKEAEAFRGKLAEACGKLMVAEARADALAQEVERLRGALEPFATYLDIAKFDLDNRGDPLPDDLGMGWVYLTVGVFRRARAALGDRT